MINVSLSSFSLLKDDIDCILNEIHVGKHIIDKGTSEMSQVSVSFPLTFTLVSKVLRKPEQDVLVTFLVFTSCLWAEMNMKFKRIQMEKCPFTRAREFILSQSDWAISASVFKASFVVKARRLKISSSLFVKSLRTAFAGLHQHSTTRLGHLTQFTYLTTDPVYQEQAQTLVKVFPAGPGSSFWILCSSHTDWIPKLRSTDSGCFYASSRVSSLSTPPYPRGENNKLKTMPPLRVSLSEERIGMDGAVLEREWGRFRVDMAWNWINKWRNPFFVVWVQQSQRMARGAATMRDPSKPKQTSFSLTQ